MLIFNKRLIFNFLILIFSFTIFNFHDGINAQWIYDIEYPNDCSQEPDRVSAYSNNVCYTYNISYIDGTNLRSHRYSYISNTVQILRQEYSVADCGGTPTEFSYTPDLCSGKSQRIYRFEPPLEKPGYISIERVPSQQINIETCGYYQSSRHMVKINTCVTPYLNYNTYMLLGDAEHALGNVVTNECPKMSLIGNYQRCQANLDTATAIQTPDASQLNWNIQYVVQSFMQIRVNSISSNLKYAYKYKVEFYEVSSSTYKVACIGVLPNEGCTIILNNQAAYTMIKVTAIGEQIFPGTVFTNTTDQITFPQAPVLSDLKVIDKGTKWITINYSFTNTPTSYIVQHGSTQFTDCSSTTTCTLTGLTFWSGKTVNIFVSAKNAAGTSLVSPISDTLYKTITVPTFISVIPSQNQLLVYYNTTEGIPNQTKYTVKRDGQVVTGCSAISTTQCTISGLPKYYKYNISVDAENDGDQASNFTNVKYLLPTMNPILINEIRTTRVSFNYSSTETPQFYNVYVNSIYRPTCRSVSNCTIYGLTPGSSLNISVSATNDVGTSDLSESNVVLYPSVSAPSVTPTTHYNSISVQYESTGGIIKETVYTTQLDDVDVTGCIKIKSLECDITGLQPNYNHNVSVTAFNDGESKTTRLNVSAPEEPPMIGPQYIKVESNLTYIFVEWSSISGGPGGLTTYDLSISLENTTWALICEDIQDTSCKIDNLIPGTLYYLKVTAENDNFGSIYNYTSISTTDETKEKNCQCINGNCDLITLQCICYDGWIGLNCEIKYDKPTNFTPPNIIPNPNQPEIIIIDNQDNYSFKLNRIIERTNENTEVYSVDLTRINWTLSENKQQIIVHPLTSLNITMNQWIYQANISKASELTIQFTQILPIGNQSIPDYPMEFAGEKFNLSSGALKYQLDIKKWDFDSKLNILEIQSSINMAPYDDQCFELPDAIFSNNSQVSTYFIQQPNGNVIYGRISRRVLIDLIPRLSNVQMVKLNQSTTMISTYVSHFDESLTIDPDFSVLINARPETTNKCKGESKNNNWRIIVGVVVGIGGLTAVTAITVILIKKNRKENQYNAKMENRLKKLDNNNKQV